MKNKKITIAVTAIISSLVVFCATFAFFLYRYNLDKYYYIGLKKDEVRQENVSNFYKVRDLILDEYYQDIDLNTLFEGAVSGLAEAVNDPYTVYYTKEEMDSFYEISSGSYVGIGVTVNEDEMGILNVVEPFSGSPAALAGMKKGDKIIKVNGEDVTIIDDTDLVISKIKGKENTSVTITVYRPSIEKEIDMKMIRKRIDIVNVESEIIEGNIGYVRIVMFDENCAVDFINSLNNLIIKGIKGLIIDLRDNPGGSYSQVVAIADCLLPEGLIIYTEDRNGNREEEFSDSSHLNIPMAVLVNQNSASASEILAAGIQDHNVGCIVGTTTYGKGLVQQIFSLEGGAGIKITISRYFTPNGVCLQDNGVKPDIIIETEDKYRYYAASQIPADEDIQLITAVDRVKSEID